MKNGKESVASVDRLYRSVRKAHDSVDIWKVGKLNHNKAVEHSVDWPKFYKSSSS